MAEGSKRKVGNMWVGESLWGHQWDMAGGFDQVGEV